MKKYSLLFLVCLIVPSVVQAQTIPTPPRAMFASWAEGSGTNRTVNLNWTDSNNETSFHIQRKIGTGAWTALTAATNIPAGSTSFSDTTVPRGTSALRTFVYYRLRAKNSVGDSDAAEVATVGVPFSWPTSTYDTDADGILESQEGDYSGTDTDWRNALRDSDGDGVPNAWEANGVTAAPGVSGIVVTVDASRTASDTVTETRTISAAITRLTGTTLNLYRMIVVRPGVYNENINYAGTFQIAFVADKSAANRYKETVIRGLGTTPVANVIGSCVFSGFVFERATGSQGAAVNWSEPALPVARVSVVGLSNCIFRGMNTGATSVVEQSRGRLLIEHCTMYNNGVANGSAAHSYSLEQPVAAEVFLKTTARLHVENSVFWNPINITVPEFQSDGEHQFVTSIMYGVPPSGCVHVNPNLKPSGYLINSGSAAASGGTYVVGATTNDIHGESYSTNATGALRARGADSWLDSDTDLIPDFADRLIFDPLNATADLDDDQMNELVEYQDDTDIYAADSVYITRDEALRFFIRQGDIDFLTQSQGDARYVLKGSSGQTLRVAPGGNIPMGSFSGGSPPP